MLDKLLRPLCRRVCLGLLLVIASILLAACAQTPSRPRGSASSAVVSQQTQTLSARQTQALLHPANITYHLGPGDVLAIGVYLHPDLSIPPPGFTTSRGPPGAVVSNNGNLQLPLLGEVYVSGLTVSQLREKLTHAYARYIKHPSISVQVQQARSIRYYLLGEFAAPGVKFPDRPMHLLDALALGGSINLKDADLHGAYVVQNGHKLPLNFERLLLRGDLSQNVRLQTGDTIVVPSNASMTAFMFGAVGKPGPVAFVNGRLTLLQALAEAGMNLQNLSPAKLEEVRVIRSAGTKGQYFVIDAARILKGRAAPFELQSGDIVFVPGTALGSWNAVIQQLLPSLQLVGATLNPFVQIKFLNKP